MSAPADRGSRHVVHLVEPGGEGGVGALRAAAVAVAGVTGRHSVIVLGAADDAAVARACGVPVLATVSTPRSLAAGERATRRAVAACGPADLLHAWSAEAARQAASAAPTAPRLATLALPSPIAEAGTRLSAVGRSVAGLAGEVGPPAAALPLVLAPRAGGQRDEVRARWGVAPGEFVIGLAVDPAPRGDALAAAKVTVPLLLTGRSARLVVSPRSARRREAEAWVRAMGREGLIVQDERLDLPWQAIAGLDAALQIAVDRPAPLAAAGLLELVGAGVPVVAVDGPVTREVLEGGRLGTIVSAEHPVNEMTRAALHLLDRPGGRGAAAAEAARRVAAAHPPQRFCAELEALYVQACAARA